MTRFCKAWECASETRSETLDALVEPKAVSTDPRVSRETVATMLKAAFGPDEAQPAEDPQIPVETQKALVLEPAQVSKPVDLQPVWIAFGIFAFLSFCMIMSLLHRLENLETWIHARMMSRT